MSGRKSFRHVLLERFLDNICASQSIAICFVEYRFKTQEFWNFSMQGRKNGTDLKVLLFFFLLSSSKWYKPIIFLCRTNVFFLVKCS